jgi:hypothetical protein
MPRRWWPMLALLAGCASATATAIPSPDGRATYRIECPGPAAAVRACLRRAHTLCPTGFSILDARPPLDLSAAEPSQRGGFVRRQVVVRCFWRDPRLGDEPPGYDPRHLAKAAGAAARQGGGLSRRSRSRSAAAAQSSTESRTLHSRSSTRSPRRTWIAGDNRSCPASGLGGGPKRWRLIKPWRGPIMGWRRPIMPS